jgi:hypothetical protein
MKATIDIPDALYRAVRMRTDSEGTTLRHVAIALLGDWMQRPDWHPHIRTEVVLTGEPNPVPRRRLKCFGIARSAANLNVSHDWKDIKKDIEDGWAQETLEKEQRIGAL